MKRNKMMMLAFVGMIAGLSAVNAEESRAQVVAIAETAALKLSIEEQAFVAQLSDQNRKTFSDRLSTDQRKAVMIAVKNGANVDEAVQKMIAATELKELSAVADAEKANAATSAAK